MTQLFAPAPLQWITTAIDIIGRDERCVLTFVSSHQGSTPREKGTWMLVTENKIFGTLGGGEVEHSTVATARDLLAGRSEWERSRQKYLLGPDLGQCCGGAMSIIFEPLGIKSQPWLKQASNVSNEADGGYVIFPASHPVNDPRVISGSIPDNLSGTGDTHIQALIDDRPRIALYGAGHVGRAIAAIAPQLPILLDVIDERPEALASIPLAENVRALHWDNPPSHARNLKNARAALVMTHSHGLDYRLCQTLLGNKTLLENPGDLAYIGLIGSATKAARFRHAFKLENMHEQNIARLTCPIGANGHQGKLEGKEPGIIAITALSEILSTLRSVHIKQNSASQIHAGTK